MQATVEQLSQILVFADLTALDLEHLPPYTQLQHYSKREIIIQEGDRLPKKLYALLSGSLQITKTATTGKETILRTLPPGEIFAAQIIGKYENGTPVAIDQRTNRRLNPTDINDKIIIYEREVKEWFLNPALELIEKDSFNNGFIVLMICMSYFEGVEQYKTGIKSISASRECFKKSVKRLYLNKNKFKNEELNKLYSKSRCGLFCDHVFLIS